MIIHSKHLITILFSDQALALLKAMHAYEPGGTLS